MVLNGIEDIVKYATESEKSIEIELTDNDRITLWNHPWLWVKGHKGYFVHESYSVNGEIVLVTGEEEIVTTDNYKDKLTKLCIKIASAWQEFAERGGKLTISNSFEGEQRYQFNNILQTYFISAYRTAFKDINLLLVPED